MKKHINDDEDVRRVNEARSELRRKLNRSEEALRPAPELNEVAFTISADGVRFGDVATVSVDCAPVTAPQIAHRGRIEINFPAAFGFATEENDQLIPGELLERIEAAGGTYEFHVMEIMPTTDAIGHGGYIEGIYVDFECAAGVEMTGNLFTYTSTVCNVPDHAAFPFQGFSGHLLSADFPNLGMKGLCFSFPQRIRRPQAHLYTKGIRL